MRESILRTKSYQFALNSVRICKDLIEKKEFILSKQLIRSSTSIGANIREANYAQSTKDFIHKLSISLKECDETQYWLELLYDSNYLDEVGFISLNQQSSEIKRMLSSSILTSKKNLKKNKCII
jgi:four helix bundle protein